MANAAGRKLTEGEIASYYLDNDGILVAYSKSIKRTVENISGNIQLVKQITGNKKSSTAHSSCKFTRTG